jgi:hypothetical protein
MSNMFVCVWILTRVLTFGDIHKKLFKSYVTGDYLKCTAHNSLQSVNTTWMTRENVYGSDGSAEF